MNPSSNTNSPSFRHGTTQPPVKVPHADSLGASYAERPLETPPAAGEAAHTPTPWNNNATASQPSAVGLYDVSGALIGVAISPADAAFIVRACNSHAALVELARKRHAYLSDNEADMQADGEWGDAEQDELEALSAALEQARKP